ASQVLRPSSALRSPARSPRSFSISGNSSGSVRPRLKSVTEWPRASAAATSARPVKRGPPRMRRRTGSSLGREASRRRSAERVREYRLNEAAERAVARVLHVGLGRAAAHTAILMQHVGGRHADFAAIVLQKLLAERRAPQHDVLAVGGGYAALKIVADL